jgi:hypothetical protein
MNRNQPENMASYEAYTYPEATTNDYSRTVLSFANSQPYITETKYQNNTQSVPESYSQGQGQHMSRIPSNDSFISQNSLSPVPSPQTPMTHTDMSEWDGSYSDQTQYPSEYYGTEQQWYPDDNGYSTGYIEPSTSYIMSPVDNIDAVNYQYPQSMSLPMSMST